MCDSNPLAEDGVIDQVVHALNSVGIQHQLRLGREGGPHSTQHSRSINALECTLAWVPGGINSHAEGGGGGDLRVVVC